MTLEQDIKDEIKKLETWVNERDKILRAFKDGRFFQSKSDLQKFQAARKKLEEEIKSFKIKGFEGGDDLMAVEDALKAIRKILGGDKDG